MKAGFFRPLEAFHSTQGYRLLPFRFQRRDPCRIDGDQVESRQGNRNGELLATAAITSGEEGGLAASFRQVIGDRHSQCLGGVSWTQVWMQSVGCGANGGIHR